MTDESNDLDVTMKTDGGEPQIAPKNGADSPEGGQGEAKPLPLIGAWGEEWFKGITKA